jgi:uncharacterized membrane protein YuzA (DUF378 family)
MFLPKDEHDVLYYKKLAYKVAVMLILIGALNWLMVGAFKLNLVERILGATGGRVVYIIVGLCALAIMFNRDTYLPFLGESVAPCSAFPDRTPPGATKEVVVYVRPGAKVIYWASEPAMEGMKQVVEWKQAYGQFENAGLTTADVNGKAVLRIRPPQAYNVPGHTLEAHVHYRVCEPKGWMGRIQTKFIQNDGFLDFDSGSASGPADYFSPIMF